MNPSLNPRTMNWRHQQLLEEARAERLAALVRPRPRAWRGWTAQVLLALATWLSPEIGQPVPTFEWVRARRNGHA